MQQELFDKLSAQEREELALCGINSPEQLGRCSVKQLLRDLQLASQYFPNKHITLTEARLRAILSAPPSEPQPVEPAATTKPEADDELHIVRKDPVVSYRHRDDKNEQHKEKAKSVSQAMLHSPVRSSHPFLALFASLSTLLLIIPAISIPALIFVMIMNVQTPLPLNVLAVCLLVVPCIPFVLFSRLATCPVCHMRIFSFGQYTRNRAAHYLPFFGYNIATALHTILLWRYNCPACGTPVKLIGSKGRRIHH